MILKLDVHFVETIDKKLKRTYVLEKIIEFIPGPAFELFCSLHFNRFNLKYTGTTFVGLPALRGWRLLLSRSS